MARKWKDADGDTHIDVDCDCNGHMLRIIKMDGSFYRADSEEEQFMFDLSFWEYQGEQFGFWTRLKMAWKTFRTGYSSTGIVLTTDAVRELVKELDLASRPAEEVEDREPCLHPGPYSQHTGFVTCSLCGEELR